MRNTPIPLAAVIYTQRPLYRHYGVYIGDGSVIHFAAKKGFETNAKEAFIQETTLDGFLRGDRLYVEPEAAGAFPVAEVLARARGELGRQKGEYSLVFNNCEHFAHWCKYGKKRSRQVEVAVASVAATVVAASTAIAAAVAASRNTKNRTES